MELQDALKAKQSLKKEQSWWLTLSNFRIYDKATVIKMMVLGQEWHTCQWDKIEFISKPIKLIFISDAKST
jgi:hypothetical protein